MEQQETGQQASNRARAKAYRQLCGLASKFNGKNPANISMLYDGPEGIIVSGPDEEDGRVVGLKVGYLPFSDDDPDYAVHYETAADLICRPYKANCVDLEEARNLSPEDEALRLRLIGAAFVANKEVVRTLLENGLRLDDCPDEVRSNQGVRDIARAVEMMHADPSGWGVRDDQEAPTAGM